VPAAIVAPDVTSYNFNDSIFYRGDEDKNGSLRIIPGLGAGRNLRIQVKINGHWQATGLELSQGSLHMGRDLNLEAFSGWLETFSLNTGHRSLVPHSNFTELAGSEQVHMPFLGVKKIFEDLYRGDPVTAPVIVTLYNDIGDAPGDIIWEKTFPTSHWAQPSLTVIPIDLEGEVQVGKGEKIWYRLQSENDISLDQLPVSPEIKQPFTYMDVTAFEEINLVQESFLIAEDAGLLVNLDASFSTASPILPDLFFPYTP
jgi:hypothetical protein